MKGINKVFILGTLGADPQPFTFQDGNTIANLSLATSEKWNDRNGQPQETTQWHKIKLSGKLAEIALSMLAKGAEVYIEGSLKTRKWVDKNNQTQYITEILGDKMEIITSPKQLHTQAKDSLHTNQNTSLNNAMGQPANPLNNKLPAVAEFTNNPNNSEWIPF